MPVRQIAIDGFIMNVEVDHDDIQPPVALVERGGAAEVVTNRVVNVGQQLRDMLGAVTAPVRTAFEQAGLEGWSIELSIGFKGEAGIPCLTKGEANASIKVTANWKRQPSPPSAPALPSSPSE